MVSGSVSSVYSNLRSACLRVEWMESSVVERPAVMSQLGESLSSPGGKEGL